MNTKLLSLLGLVVLLGLPCGQAQVISDNFDSYADQAALNAVWPPVATAITLSTGQAVSKPNAVYQGTVAQSSYRTNAPTATPDLKLSFWFYDGGTGLGRTYLETTAATTGPRVGYSQILAIGKNNGVATSKYNGRVAVGGLNWFTLDGAANRSVGWHFMEIVGKADGTADWKVDGVVGANKPLANFNFNWVVVGSGLSSGTFSYFDDVNMGPIAPVIIRQPTNQTVSVGGTATFSVVASGPGTAAMGYQWYRNNEVIPNATGSSYTTPQLGCSDGATYTVSCNNGWGQVTSQGAVLTVADTTPPSITCPANMTVPATGAGGTIVTYTATATDYCDPAPTVTCTPPSGSSFPAGTTTVSCTARDASGNASSCSLLVTVEPLCTHHFFISNHLPPTNGVYLEHGQGFGMFPNGVAIRNTAWKNFSAAVAPPASGGTPIFHSFTGKFEMEMSLDGGLTWGSYTADINNTLRINYLGSDGDGVLYDVAIAAFDIFGGGLPAEVVLRLNPTKSSAGQTRIAPIAGGNMICSYFDIYIQVTLDGGVTWSPAPQAAHVELNINPESVPGMQAETKLQPPLVAGYQCMCNMGWCHVAPTLLLKGCNHRLFSGATLPPLPTPPAPDATNVFTYNFQWAFQMSTPPFLTIQPGRAPASATVRMVHIRDFAGKSYYQTEIVAMSITGGDLPTGVVLRAKPGLASEGGACIAGTAASGYLLNSFFDIFTEISTDGGMSWLSLTDAPCHVVAQPLAPQYPFPSDFWPPMTGEWASSNEVRFASGIVISKLLLNSFDASFPPPPIGVAETHICNFQAGMMISTDDGATFDPAWASGNQGFVISGMKDQDATRYFETESPTLRIFGGSLPVFLRGSPTRASRSQLSETVQPTGGFRISSFFDVFLEVSTDGGLSWQPASSGALTMYMQPRSAIPPMNLFCPSSITVTVADPGGGIVSYSAPVTSGGCPPVTVTCNPPSGSVFPVGNTAVSCHAEDTCGQVADCSFVVTARYVPPPRPWFFTVNNVLPLRSTYISPPAWRGAYANGVVISNLFLARYTAAYPPPPAGGEQTNSCGSALDLAMSTDGGATFTSVHAPVDMSFRIRNLITPGGADQYDTEMLVLNVTLPGTMMMRESPTRASTGRIEISTVPGGYTISSFFDIYTEVSLDGGMTWVPSGEPAHLVMYADPSLVTPILTPTALFPPPVEEYAGQSSAYVSFPSGVILRQEYLKLFTRSIVPPPLGGTYTNVCDLEFDTQISYDGGVHFSPARIPGTAKFGMSNVGVDGFVTLSFQANEVWSFDMAGGDLAPMMVFRASPVLGSRGGTSYGGGGGGITMSSFFDIFLELSTDGGATWQAGINGPLRLQLIKGAPENNFPLPTFPPESGNWVHYSYFGSYPSGVVISNVVLRNSLPSYPPPAPGVTVTHSCTLQMDMVLSLDGGASWTALTAPAHETYMLTGTMDYGGAQYFDTEMLELTVSGGTALPANFMLRESPTRASMGRMSERAIGTASSIQSFFDVYTEVSLDGGQTWSHSMLAPTHLYLQPAGSRPTILQQPQSTNGPCGGTAFFMVIATGSPTLTYQWLINGTPLVGETNSTLTLSPLHMGQNGAAITVSVSNPNGSVMSDIAWLTVYDIVPPTIICPSNMVVGTTPQKCSAMVQYPAPQAWDDCTQQLRVTCTPENGSVFPLGITTVLCSAIDLAGNSNGCTFTITVQDTEPPMISCPVSVSVPAIQGQCRAEVSYQPPQARDNCDVTNIVCTPPSPSMFPVGTTVVQCTAYDVAGNSASCSFTVTVTDDEPPSIICPPNMTTNTLPGECVAKVNYPMPNATDNCTVTNITCTPPPLSTFPLGPSSVLCIARDSSGNVVRCSFLVTVVDTELPKIVCPADVTVPNQSRLCSAYVQYPEPQASDNCTLTNVACVPPSGSQFPVGANSVLCTAWDESGNSNTCNFIVKVVDTENPHIFCPSDMTNNAVAGDCSAKVQYPMPQASDNCRVTNIVCTPPLGFIFPLGVNVVTCTASDESGNSATCTFNVVVLDDQPPTIQCPGNMTTNTLPGVCFGRPNYPLPTASDNCLVTNISCYPPPLADFALGTTIVMCTARDSSGNIVRCSFSVTIVDNEPPKIDCPPEQTVDTEKGQCSARWQYPMPTATDNCTVTNVTCVPPSGSLFPLGITSVLCTAYDEAGNSNTCSFKVKVVDNEPPGIACPPSLVTNTLPGSCEAKVDYGTPRTQDNCAVTNVTCTPPALSMFPLGTTVVQCTATDNSGNKTSCSFTVTVVDVEPPTLICPNAIIAPTDPGACYKTNVTWDLNAGDNCTLTNLTCTPPSGSTFPKGVTSVICVAIDGSSNVFRCAFTVNIRDLEPPQIVCPGNIETNTDSGLCAKTNVTWKISARDNCPNLGVVCTPPSGSTFPRGATQVTCIATDESGNTNGCSFWVLVRDFEPPQISCPKGVDTEADPGQCSRSNVTFVATASDNCQVVTLTCDPPSGSTFPVGNTIVLCHAIDSSANSNSCTFVVTIRDLQPPRIICPSNICVMGYAPTGAVVNFPAPTASDNCEGVTVSCVPPSGSLFPLGSTLVTCLAIDMGQNGNSCTFQVRVAQPCPKLDISLKENPQIPGTYDIWICWTASPNSDCALQYTDSLNPPIVWQPWLGPIITQGGNQCVVIRNPSGMRFFRLHGNCSFPGAP